MDPNAAVVPEEEDNLKFCCKRFFSNHWKGLLSVLIPIVFSFLLFLEPQKPFCSLYILMIMIFYWISECVPLHISSLIPVVLSPIFGILDTLQVLQSFFKDTIVLFMSGIIVALAIEYSQLHKRIAMCCIMIIGSSPLRLFFSSILVTMLISMWLSNSATTAMMCPIVKAILMELQSAQLLEMTVPNPNPDEPPLPTGIYTCFVLGVAYAASIGGIGTPIGTGTNLVWKGLYDGRFPKNKESDFLKFCMITVPPMLLITLTMYIIMSIIYLGLFRPNSKQAESLARASEGRVMVADLIKAKYKELGPMSMHQIQVTILFLLMVVLLFARKPGLFPGYADFLSEAKISGSCGLTLVMILLFALPTDYGFCRYFCCKVKEPEGRRGNLLSWKFTAENFPWSLVILLGGGFAFAASSDASGLSKMIGDKLGVWLSDMPGPLIQLSCILLGIFVTAFGSNVAAANVLIPVFIELAVAVELHPFYLTLPAAIAVSMAFHLPISTPPNAIVSAFANIPTKDMMIGGIGPTLATIVILWISFQTWIYVVFPHVGEFPDWAKSGV